MAARPPYRPGQVSATQTAHAFAAALATQIRAYRANVATYANGTWGKGYHIAPSVHVTILDGAAGGAALVRYIPAPCRDLRAAWGDKRNPTLDLTQDQALAAAAERLQRDGWECEFQPEKSTDNRYMPTLLVRKGTPHE